jgi:transposase-like protein
MSQREAERLRRELSKVTGRRGPCFPSDLKKRASAWIAEQRAAGTTVAELAKELGVASGTVLRWSADARANGSRAMVPVEVIAEPVAGGALSVTSPAGFRVDGLTLAEAAALLRALG